MHILESASHQLPLAKNVVWPAKSSMVSIDDRSGSASAEGDGPPCVLSVSRKRTHAGTFSMRSWMRWFFATASSPDL